MKNNWFIKKVNSKAGESLPEVLIAVLIVAMGMLMLSTMLNVSSHMLDKSQSDVKAVYDNASKMDAISGAGSKSQIVIKEKAQATGETVEIELYNEGKLISYNSKGLK